MFVCYYGRRPIMFRQSAIALIAAVLAGCFYPPQQKPLPESRSRLRLEVPYYRAWNAVRQVIVRNDYRIITENPDDGTIEAQAVGGFRPGDADCGELKGIAARYSVQPDLDSSAIYDFEVQPRGNEASSVKIEASFTAPLHVPLHPPRGEQCVSRGAQEARLLTEISQQVREEPPPTPKSPPALLPARKTVESAGASGAEAP